MPSPCSERDGFFGREQTLETLQRSFAEGARLVTLTGSAGVGKSRLGAVFAASWKPAGALLCDLGSAREKTDLWRSVTQALDLSLGSATAGGSERALGYGLSTRGPLLLVLDNVDPVLDVTAATVLEWLQQAPEVRFLVTSRERLRAAGEHVILVDGLDESSAVRLFADRTRRVRSDFQLTASSTAIVAALARELEGNPLAIELCAARGATLGPSQLLSMSRRLDKLASDTRAVHGTDPRHATLRSAIEQSWDLLAPGDREALACICVFSGGFDLDAAEQVLGQSALDTLARLVDKSLVRADAIEPGRLRYRLYATIREYASMNLDEASRRRAEKAHAEYFSALPADRARVEFENLLSAHAWALSQPVADTQAMRIAVAIALALETPFFTQGPPDGYGALLDATLSKDGVRATTPPASLAQLVLVRGIVHVAHGEHEAAQDLFEQAVTYAVAAKDPSLECFGHARLCGVHVARGRYDLADEASARAAALESVSSPPAQAFFHRARAYRLARDDRVEDALVEYEAALRVLRRFKDPHEEAVVLGQMGTRHFELGNLVEARTRLERAVDMLRALGERRFAAYFSGKIGEVEREEGNLDVAEKRCEEAANELRSIGDRHLEAWFIAELGNVAFLRDDPALATRCYADALLLFDEVGDVLIGAFVRLRAAIARASLGRPVEAARELAAAERALDQSGVRGFASLRAIARAYVLGADDPDELMQRFASGRDVDAEARFALILLARKLDRGGAQSPAAETRDSRASVEFASDASWFSAKPGERVPLGRKGALRRIAARMLADRLSRPGVALSVHDLFEAGWPGQRVAHELACNRVYAAISRLRAMGLADILVTRDDGYLLDARASVRVEKALAR